MRLIDADKLRNRLFKNPYADIHDFIGMIHDMPTETPAGNAWIPCIEKLPSEEEFLKSYLRNHYAAEFLVQIYGASRPTTLYYRDGVWFDNDFDKYNVIAWMPLPEPWEGERDE